MGWIWFSLLLAAHSVVIQGHPLPAVTVPAPVLRRLQQTNGSIWLGTAPFCIPASQAVQACSDQGLTYVRGDPKGDGNLCQTGEKVLCTGTLVPNGLTPPPTSVPIAASTPAPTPAPTPALTPIPTIDPTLPLAPAPAPLILVPNPPPLPAPVPFVPPKLAPAPAPVLAPAPSAIARGASAPAPVPASNTPASSDPENAPAPGKVPSSENASSGFVGLYVGAGLAGAAVCLALAAVGLVCRFRSRRRRLAASLPERQKEGKKDEMHDNRIASWNIAATPHQECFTVKQLQKATANFSNAVVVGKGSFGTVYKAVLGNGLVVAVKRLETRPGRRDLEERLWKAEVEALSKVRHKNLVPLLGVCVDSGERLLVFEYFAKGSLDKRLHHPSDLEPVLSWVERMSIARSICRGLTYLHSGIRPPMVHRDIKAANILLSNGDATDACIADFGLAHLVQDTGARTSTMIKGTVPYMAPEYLHGGARFLAPECDVYSFGMLSLELISGRPVVSQLESGVVEHLLKVAMDMMKHGRELDLIDPKLALDYDEDEVRNYIRVAMTCLRPDPAARPTMEAVCSRLAAAPTEVSDFKEQDFWEADGTSAFLGSSSSGTSSQSTVLVASRFVTPR